MHNAARMAVWFRVALIPDGVYAVARIRTSGDLDQARLDRAVLTELITGIDIAYLPKL
jgi:hypothetical protein